MPTTTQTTQKQLQPAVVPLAEWTDEQLLLDYRRTGNQRLFETLVQRYEQELFAYLRAYLGDAQQAEDTFQIAFLHVHLKCDQFEEGRKVRPWIYKIAINRAIDNLRKNRRRSTVSLDAPHDTHDPDSGGWVEVLPGTRRTPINRLIDQEESHRSLSVLAKLPEHLKQVVTLVFFQDMKYREAAEFLSIPVGTVKSRMHTALGRMHRLLQPQPI
tara:strand:- start:569 stop:1210 length:642 start_codon:yes stop_codon:yes gene_type:complete